MDAMPSTVWPSQRQTYFQDLLGLLQEREGLDEREGLVEREVDQSDWRQVN